MSDYWLRDYILSSEKRGFCIKRVCTTCGSLTFKAGVLRRLGLNARLHLPVPRDREVWSAVARELAQVEYDPTRPGVEDGLMCLLMMLWMPGCSPTLEQILKGSWAGALLERMKSHHASRLEHWREYDRTQGPEATRARREVKAQGRQEAHAARLERKKARDRAWRASQTALREAENTDDAG